jgi:hypothetical protein
MARRKPSERFPTIAEFRDLFAYCSLGKSSLYSGMATGFVYLENGDKYPVRGNSGKFVAVNCSIGTQ